MTAKEFRDGIKALASSPDPKVALEQADRIMCDYLEGLAKGELDGRSQRYVLEGLDVYRAHRGNA